MKRLTTNIRRTSIYLLLATILYVYIAYFLERREFIALLISFALLFLFTYKIIQSQKENFAVLIGIAIFFRLLFVFSLPNLSQDFYRFIWDGRLLSEGINPYTNLPQDFIVDAKFYINQAPELFEKMGNLSATHYSNYPPINQLFFAAAAICGGSSILGSTIVLRLFIILADFGILYFGSKLLKKLGFEKNRIFWYLLNPLVIIELTGNLHFEGVMLFFLVWSIYLLYQNKWKQTAVLIALSISTKLLPLLLLPLLYRKLGLRISIYFYCIVIAINLLLFLPFLSSELIYNYSATIGLWFTNFEFNASFYYLIRSIGYYFTGYNIIQTTGKIVPFLIILFILYRSFFYKNKSISDLFMNFLIVLSTYFFLSTTVHPWYVINLICIGIFTRYNFPLMWSFTAILSYSAYSQTNFQENFYLIAIEYALVFLYIIYEVNPLFRNKINTILNYKNQIEEEI